MTRDFFAQQKQITARNEEINMGFGNLLPGLCAVVVGPGGGSGCGLRLMLSWVWQVCCASNLIDQPHPKVGKKTEEKVTEESAFAWGLREVRVCAFDSGQEGWKLEPGRLQVRAREGHRSALVPSAGEEREGLCTRTPVGGWRRKLPSMSLSQPEGIEAIPFSFYYCYHLPNHD